MKRRTTRAAQREKKKAQRKIDMLRPGGKSKYALKERNKERARGYSRRPTSPFFMSPAQVRLERELAAQEPSS